MGNFTFSKHERLSKKKEIESLFAQGKSFNLPPLRVISKPNPDQSILNHQVLFTVPTRNFKRAVDRNLIKRRLREAYRLNKSKLTLATKLLVAYIFTAKNILPYKIIEEKLVQSLNKLNESKQSH